MLLSSILLASTSLVSLANSKQLPCSSESIPTPQYLGTEVISLAAKEVRGYEEWSFIEHLNIPFERRPLDFCNVTVTYTHPGLGDEINVYVWLPLEDWNGNFLGMGGGGLAAGIEGGLAPAVGRGYAAANTDTGHTFQGDPIETGIDAKSWALTSPGNVNLNLLQNFGSVALDDMPNLAKSVVESFYGGQKPKFSYWNGCSTGGRQAMMSAQRYPKNYDGILAAAPAINWVDFLVVEQWGQLLMRKENYFPPLCEFQAITNAAIEACDELDGVKDGMIAAPGLCTFNAKTVVGRKYDCNGDTRKISKSAAKIANGAWEGPKRNGKQEWFGITHETPLAGPGPFGGLLSTACDDESKNCKGTAFPVSSSWVRYFLAKDPKYDVDSMSEEEFWSFLKMSRQQYRSIMGTDDPDLEDVRAAGGKILMWHGLADGLIYPNGSSSYYERVLALDPDAHDFYRYFEVPGVAHCVGGDGAFPSEVFQALVDWVERGKAPDTLDAATIPTEETAPVKHRILCPYPQVAAYVGGNPSEASSYKCAENFGTKKASIEHSEL